MSGVVRVMILLWVRPYLIGLETRWRPGGDSSLRWLRRRLRDVAGLRGVAWGNSNMFDFLETFSSLQQISETSPRRLHQLRRLILSVTGETSPRQVSGTCWRPRRLRRRCGDCRRRRGDVPATSEQISCHLVWRRLRRRPGVINQQIIWTYIQCNILWD